MIIFGSHSVKSLLEKNPQRIFHLYLQKDKSFPAIMELAKACKIKISYVNKVELDRLSKNGVHQGLLAECDNLKMLTENDLQFIIEKKEHPFLLALDSIQDPHNLGACLRSADAAGIDAVILPKDKSVALTATVAKVASGAADAVPIIQVTNLVRTLESLKEQNIWLYGAAGEAQQSLFATKFAKSCCLVLGAEGEGLRRLTKETCDMLVKIPMQGTVSSLNVSVAAGIFMFEALRQRIS